mmetsp:Transcript_33573/g.76772  ORF Transcript_33573/g.76772 Transcript_33573/m.76772 type:complete len:292 (+) Transcript_33573:4-879(+)
MAKRRGSVGLDFACFGMDGRKARRTSLCSAEVFEKGVLLEGKVAEGARSEAELSQLEALLKTHPMFSALTAGTRRCLFDLMRVQSAAAAEVILKDGETFEDFCVLKEGEVVEQADGSPPKTPRVWGDLCLVQHVQCVSHATFTVTMPSTIWRLPGKVFRDASREAQERRLSLIMTALNEANLPPGKEEARPSLSDAFQNVCVGDGCGLLVGDTSTAFHVLLEGTVQKSDGTTLTAGCHFNVECLRGDGGKGSSHYTALSRAECAVLSAADYQAATVEDCDTEEEEDRDANV